MPARAQSVMTSQRVIERVVETLPGTFSVVIPGMGELVAHAANTQIQSQGAYQKATGPRHTTRRGRD